MTSRDMGITGRERKQSFKMDTGPEAAAMEGAADQTTAGGSGRDPLSTVKRPHGQGLSRAGGAGGAANQLG